MSLSTLPLSDKQMAFDTCEICDPAYAVPASTFAKATADKSARQAWRAEAECEGGRR
jgi:hypothetical protein